MTSKKSPLKQQLTETTGKICPSCSGKLTHGSYLTLDDKLNDFTNRGGRSYACKSCSSELTYERAGDVFEIVMAAFVLEGYTVVSYYKEKHSAGIGTRVYSKGKRILSIEEPLPFNLTNTELSDKIGTYITFA